MLLIGMTEAQFWESNPRKIYPYQEAYKKRIIENDRMAHIMGAYVHEAVSVALANGFSKSGSKKHKYREKPFMAEQEEQMRLEKMTKEERLEQVEKIFEMLDSSHR